MFELSWQVVVSSRIQFSSSGDIARSCPRHRVVRPPITGIAERNAARAGGLKNPFFWRPPKRALREALVPRGPFRFLVSATDGLQGMSRTAHCLIGD